MLFCVFCFSEKGMSKAKDSVSSQSYLTTDDEDESAGASDNIITSTSGSAGAGACYSDIVRLGF